MNKENMKKLKKYECPKCGNIGIHFSFGYNPHTKKFPATCLKCGEVFYLSKEELEKVVGMKVVIP